MRSLTKLTLATQCFIALFFVLQILSTAEAAPLEVVAQARDANGGNKEKEPLGSFRQASEDESDEDSDEDDGEDDAEQAQQSLIEQQNQQNLEESQENSDEDDPGDDAVEEARRRRRREVVETPKEEEQPNAEIAANVVETTAAVVETPAPEAAPAPAPVQTPTVETSVSPSLNRTSVLILIRDALKKVTTVLPTETVATNALQYFQLFEHFIQKTIEQVIEDYDEDEEEATTAINLSNGSEIAPEKQEISETAATNEPKEPVVPAVTGIVEENKLEQPPMPAVVPQSTISNAVVEPVVVNENKIAQETT